VLIAGGGVAALEALIALHDLAGDRVAVTLLAPEDAFVYRPLATARPFSLGHPTRHPLADIARDFGAALVQDRVVEVVPERRLVRGASGAEHAYDALVVAVGARALPVPHAITFGEDPTDESLHGLLADLEAGYVRGIAFVAMSLTSRSTSRSSRPWRSPPAGEASSCWARGAPSRISECARSPARGARPGTARGGERRSCARATTAAPRSPARQARGLHAAGTGAPRR
jgi:hypothetical protein